VSGDRSEARINRGEIESLEPAKVSIMPQGLDGLMSRQKLRVCSISRKKALFSRGFRGGTPAFGTDFE
jgi:hypothetical protein